MRRLPQDLRGAVRSLAQHPVLSLVAVTTLALGIGANAAVFNFTNSIYWQRLPAREPERLVSVFSRDNLMGTYGWTSFPDYLDYRDNSTLFEDVAAFAYLTVTLSGDAGEAESVDGFIVSGNLFRVLGVDAAAGRVLGPEDDRPGADRTVVLGHDLWQSRYGGEPGVIGRSVRLNGHEFTVLGVAPRKVRTLMTGSAGDFWVTFHQQDAVKSALYDWLQDRSVGWLIPLGRLLPGVTLEQVRDEMGGLAERLEEAHPNPDLPRQLTLVPAHLSHPWAQGALRTSVLLMTAAVGLLLLMASANVANLFLARATARGREMGIRAAMGASRGRIVQQLLTESLLLALIAGALGLALGAWGTGFIESSFRPPAEIETDNRVLGFALGVSVLTAVLFGLAPALSASGSDVLRLLKDSPHGGRNRALKRLRPMSLLAIAQVALSLVLLTAAGLILRSLGNLRGMDPGFETGKVTVGKLNLSPLGYSPSEGQEVYRRLLERLEGLPGVEAACLTDSVPLSGWARSGTVEVPELVEEKFSVNVAVVSPGYFRDLGIPLLQGRGFERQDRLRAVVNQAMARRLWPEADPLGRRFRLTRPGKEGELLEVVGVARDTRFIYLSQAPQPLLYLSTEDDYKPALSVLIRVAGPLSGVTPMVRGVMGELDPDLALGALTSFSSHAEGSLAKEIMMARMLGAFGVLALTLVAVGVFSVMSYSVHRRKREIGIRRAVGADRRDVLWLILRQAMILVGIGALLGAVGALWGVRLLESSLFGIGSTDPVNFTLAVLVLGVTALAASYLSARRANRIEPLAVLREE